MKINATKKGIITALIMIAVSLLFFYVLKYPVNGNSQFIIWGIYVAGIIWTLLEFHLRAKEPVLFKNYFSEAFKCFVVVTLLLAVYTFIFYKINPQILENALAENNKLLQQQGNRTAMEIADNEKKLRDIYIPMMLAVHTVKNLILGAVVSAVGALMLSLKK